MNLYNIIEEIEKIDPEFQDRISPRRAAIRNMTGFGSKIAVAALPFALGSLFKKAYGAASTTDVIAVLNYALTLELFEAAFYDKGVATAGLVPSSDTAYITSIRDDEDKHVAFLTSAISAAGGTPVTAAGFKYDFTAGGGTQAGPFATVFSDYKIFLALAETFEDTGVRAYKGAAPTLALNAYLTPALSIHAVEARHASAIRFLRNKLGYDSIAPWITSSSSSSNDTNIGAAVNGNYGGATPENTKTQLGIDITTLPGATSGSTISFSAATAAFDEPLTMTEVTTLLIPGFIQTT